MLSEGMEQNGILEEKRKRKNRIKDRIKEKPDFRATDLILGV